MIKEARDFLGTRQKMNLCMIFVNILIWIGLEIIGNTQNSLFMLQHGAMFAPYILEQGEYYRLISCMFLHFGVQHLAYNMLLLFFVGDMLEEKLGKIRYLIIYLGGGLVGNLLSLAVHASEEDITVSAGASGAVFAVVGALVWIVLYNRKVIRKDFLKKMSLMVILTLAEGFSETGVDNLAHIGGFLGGFLLCLLIGGKRIKIIPQRRSDRL